MAPDEGPGERLVYHRHMKSHRANMIVKYFDFDLAWAGKYRNVEKAAFWSADSDEGSTAFFPHQDRLCEKPNLG